MKLLIFVIAVYAVLSLVHSVDTSCAEYVHIAEIGGCNRNDCGVKLSNGEITTERAPVIGQRVCHKQRQDFNFKWIGF